MIIRKPTIAVLLTCHNRKDKTLKSLRNLFEQDGLEIDFKVEVFLVDDGCKDGTSDAVKEHFPLVNIIQGNGNLYWNRGMHLAWQTAVNAKDFDYYLWLNDDTFLNKTAVQTLYQKNNSQAIVCGTTQSQKHQKASYGGYSKKPRKLIIPNGKYQRIDYCNGNCVLIPRDVYQKLGLLDPVFHHALGDFDYSLRARKIGIAIYVAPEYIGSCEIHDKVPVWQCSSISWRKRLQSLYSASSGCNPAEFLVFEKRHNSLLTAYFHYFTIHLRVFFPKLWNTN